MQPLPPSVFQVRSDLEIIHERAVNALRPEPIEDGTLKKKNEEIKKILKGIEEVESGPIDEGNAAVINHRITKWRKVLDE
ncbi:hypothetical protein GCK72_025108 [Caenorhabditis remanei]|uniref:Uncharacterized protein n=1 Tax=Caenorhabditis remanei TaxID=31234 RepID=A0A6A5G1K0_CAERE|nr:hypothetical protein GCK72_025108 [Caenorhabditis remanei]KAF1748641.1 hypothetical protein GCK72_025108 [Caenorhabditis remanei]